MKKNIIYILCTFVLSFYSCTKDNSMWEDGGSLSLSMNMLDKTDVIQSRALSEEETSELNTSCRVRIYSGETLVRKYEGTSKVPEQILLSSGDYKVRVTAGDSVAAAFDKRFFEGVENFNISKGSATEVNVTCTIKNTVINILWDSSLKEIFKDYQVTAKSSTGELIFTADNDKVGYFSLPEDDNVIKLTFKGTKISGDIYTEENDLLGNASTLYNVTYKFSSSTTENGGGLINIQVDEKALGESSSSIVIKQRPVISLEDKDGAKIDIDKSHTLQVGAQDPYYITVATSSSLKTFILRNQDFQTWGIQNELNMMNLTDEEIEELKTKGLELVKKTPAISPDGAFWVVRFNQPLISQITDSERECTTEIIVEDENSKSRNATWNLIVSNSTVVTAQLKDYTVWTNKARLLAEVVSEPKGTVKFRYRNKEAGEWFTVDAVKEETSYYADVTGLLPATTYEYQVMDGETLSNIVCEFTTESNAQLPNNTFTEWHKNDKTWYIYNSGDEMFWDSGNEGGTTGFAALSPYNMTTQGTDYYHTSPSVKMVSKETAGILAAGNLFVGDFLGTENTTKGILGWGRPWVSRPKALKGYVRYVPVPTSHEKLPDGDDDGIIYIAIGDWTGASYNKEWPVVIRTLNPETDLFNTSPGTYTGDGIIAYGEKVFEKETKGADGGMIEFDIPLDYRSLDRKPTSIIIVASSSRYGDYYIGGSGSSMWLDDLELIYE